MRPSKESELEATDYVEDPSGEVVLLEENSFATGKAVVFSIFSAILLAIY